MGSGRVWVALWARAGEGLHRGGGGRGCGAPALCTARERGCARACEGHTLPMSRLGRGSTVCRKAGGRAPWPLSCQV